jgi:hypothetical protein
MSGRALAPAFAAAFANTRLRWCGYLLASTLVWLAGCATPPPPVPRDIIPNPIKPEPITTLTAPTAEEPQLALLRNLATQQEQLDRVAAPLLLNNPDLCKTQARNLLGFTAKNQHSYSAEMIEAAQLLFGLTERLQVIGVLPGSGAARAGLRRGDLLHSAEGKALPVGPNAERAAAEILAPLANTRASIRLTIARDGVNSELVIPLTRACAFRVDLGNADNVNTYADGRRIMITRGMLEFAKSDTEIAYLIAREMAHNTLSHAAKMRNSSIVGAQIDNLIRVHPDTTMLIGNAGIKPMLPELDLAADNLALYMLARAGFSLDQATAFWQRLATQYPAGVLNGHTALHPVSTARIAAMEKTIKDIRQKQQGKRPLVP